MGHTLSLQQTSSYPSGGFVCNLCRTEGCGPVYHCSDCDFDVHVQCAAISTQQTHFSHPHHPLHLTHCGNRARKCDSCGSSIHTWSFRCELCDFDIHSMCARAPGCIMHHRHSHPLALVKSDKPPGLNWCDGCKMPVTDFFYKCLSCHFNLHQVCATLPTKVKHVKHQAHLLTLMDQPEEGPFIMCNECRKQIKGWRFHCAFCHYNLHPVCAKLVHELPHFNLDVNPACDGSNGTASMNSSLCATTSVNTSRASTVSYARMPSTSQNVLHTPVPNDKDWEAVEKVIQFAREMAKGSELRDVKGASPNRPDDEQDHCPTCLEGFDSANPKKSTSCGHYFHLACILEWMERSTDCPICRKHLNVLM